MVINIEILLTTGLVWPASSKKWENAQKAPQVSRQMEEEARMLSMIQNGGVRSCFDCVCRFCIPVCGRIASGGYESSENGQSLTTLKQLQNTLSLIGTL